MEKSPPAPPQTIIVLDDHPIDISFLRAVLEAQALPYEVQVIDHGDRAFDVVDHLAQHEPLRAPTLILLDHTLAQRESHDIVRRLQTLWPFSSLQRVRMRVTPRPTDAHTGTSPRPRWARGLAWGIGLGLLVSLGWGALSPWRAPRPSLVPTSPQAHGDRAAEVLLAAAAPAATPVVAVYPAAQGPTPTVRASVARAASESITPSDLPRQRPKVSVARSAAHRGPKAAARPRPARRPHVAPLPAARRYSVQARNGARTATHSHAMKQDRVVSAYHAETVLAVLPVSQRPEQWGVFDSAQEVERPWNRRIVNEPPSD